MSGLGNKGIMAKNLRYYIEKTGKDRRELAEIWGIPYSTVTEWLNARKYPRIDRIEIMADYFGIQKSDLIEEKVTPEKEKDNDILSDIIVRMRTDKHFFAVVSSMHDLDDGQLSGVEQVLQALHAFGK